MSSNWLHFSLEAHDRRSEESRLLFTHSKIWHPKLLKWLQHTIAVEGSRVAHFLLKPVHFRMGNVVYEGEIKTRNQFRAFFRQLNTNRLPIFEPFNIVAARTALPANDPLAQFEEPFVR